MVNLLFCIIFIDTVYMLLGFPLKVIVGLIFLCLEHNV